MNQSHQTSIVLAATAGALAICLGLVGCAAATVPGAAPSSSAKSGSGSSAAPVSKVDASDPCALVTEAEATTALGADPGAGISSTQGSANYCTYGTYPRSVLIASTPTDGKTTYDATKALRGSNNDAVTIQGLGTEAFKDTGPNNGGADVFFYQGDAYVSVTMVTADGAQASSPDPLALAMAKAAAGRL
ncbi:MAG: hypothetical protein QOH69_29 [Actinomycetota bacterium]|nr:hypothetical protein [Actinomycetota bacterium]